jgi:hypothetical protein
LEEKAKAAEREVARLKEKNSLLEKKLKVSKIFFSCAQKFLSPTFCPNICTFADYILIHAAKNDILLTFSEKSFKPEQLSFFYAIMFQMTAAFRVTPCQTLKPNPKRLHE